MGGLRDQTHGARATFAPRLVIATDHEQPGILALRARRSAARKRQQAGDLAQSRLQTLEETEYPFGLLAGAKGWICAISRHVTGNISAVALSFIVHEPSGIIDVVSERSRASSRRMNRSISVSEW